MFARIGWWIGEWLGLLVIWLLLVDTLRPTEVLAGAGAAALAAAATEAVRRAEHPHFLPYLRWVLLFWRIPGEVVRDHWLLLRHLGRMFSVPTCDTGTFEVFPFAARGEGARAIARRTLAIVYTTLPPNTLVIGMDRRRNEIILHRLEPAPFPEPVRELERRP